MDHKEAVRLQAVEKYVLGELPQNLRDEYEEHLFDCAECAADLKAAAAFVDVSREVLRTEREVVLEKDRVSDYSAWFGWLRPAIVVPAFAALLLVVGYQNIVTIPRANEKASLVGGQMFVSSFPLKRADTLGAEDARVSEEERIQVHPDESFALKFDFTPRKTFENYVGQIQDEAGRSVVQVKLPGTSANREVQVVVAARLFHAGKYYLVLAGDPEAKGQLTKANELARLPFTIEFLP
jgi:hypothetical protein